MRFPIQALTRNLFAIAKLNTAVTWPGIRCTHVCQLTGAMVPLVGLGLRDPAAGHCVIKFMHCTYSYVGLGRRHRKRDNHGTYPGRWLCSGWLETQAGSSFSTAAADCYMHQCGSLRNNASVCLMASSRMTDGSRSLWL